MRYYCVTKMVDGQKWFFVGFTGPDGKPGVRWESEKNLHLARRMSRLEATTISDGLNVGYERSVTHRHWKTEVEQFPPLARRT